MPEDEERRLMKAYGEATHAYTLAVSRLQKDRGYLARADYSALYCEAEDARLQCESARLDLATYQESNRWL